MFDRIYNWIIRRVIRMRNRDLEVDKYDNTKDVERWTAIYEGRAPWVNLSPRGNEEYITGELNTGAKIAAEMARLTTIEFESEITGSDEADYVNEDYQDIIENLRINTEYALAKGGMVMRPYHNSHTGEILVEFIQNGEFIPLKFDDSGRMTSVCFTEVIEREDDILTKMETHELHDDGTYTIDNNAWITEGAGYAEASPISLDSVPEWASLPEHTVFTDIDRPLFGYFKPPFANNKSFEQELGSSIFTRVEGLLERLDRQNSLMIHEFKATKAKIFLDNMHIQNMTPEDKRNVLDSDVYEVLDGAQLSMEGKNYIYEVYGPAIRNQSIKEEIDRLSREIESGVGLSFGFLSDVNNTEMTATEIISSKQRSYSTVRDIQKALQEALGDLVYSMMVIEAEYGLSNGISGREVDKVYQVRYGWDDSIIVDKEKRLESIIEGIDKGFLHPKHYLIEKLGMTEEQALEALEEANNHNNPPA